MKCIFISDIHIGSEFSSYEELCAFLEDVECDKLFLIGDIFDLWVHDFSYIRKKYAKFFTILRKLYFKGIEIHYINGNHDDNYEVNVYFKNFNPKSETVLELEGNYFKIIHGHQFDYLIKNVGWATRFLYWLQNLLAWVVGLKAYRWIGMTFSKVLNKNIYLLDIVHEAVKKEYEDKFDGVIFAHSHIPEFKIIEDNIIDKFYFINTGDWVGSNTYIEYEDGNFSLIDYTKTDDTTFHYTKECLNLRVENEAKQDN